ncbi:MAG: elongation factor G [Bacteroidales bacterium]|uniref:elongation factor G n=1 Tax=Candidatus Cryptobacteroides sp. TaxID=2952915 RepID=UPI002A6FE324|nr:elongation factor G [Candidatus Cryptobacteroides sp.]MBS7278109.1 elongation factor G [Bacteroidales bacterium]MCI6525602.1 elongation factor G [Bacteroidales bacterium]MDD5914355.1 elongation factor G [Bacteroidales bacterium]MDD6829497.1 elongation factor G [Bacteroidales bacterium]MDD7134787.1 elongation factor G [Bacteroidales bacterium]
MKEYSNKDIKNVVLLGSSKSGKTTLSEAMLYEGKVIDRRGTVEDKNTVSDNDELEKVNQRSIYATPLYAEFMGKKVNIIDAPGSDDFVGGAISAFRVCENGILVVNAQQGVEVGTSSWIRSADKHKIPLIVAVNQLDGEKADWETTIAALKEELGRKMIIVQFPIATGAGFNGFIDVLTNKYYNFKDANGTREDLDIPADFADQAEMTRQELIEKAAEFDDSLMEKFFEEGTLSEDDIRKGLSLGIRNCEVTPVFCVSAKKDIGVKRLLEFTKNVALSPDVDDTKPASLFIYKNMLEPHLGEVSYFKVMSGVITPGIDLEDPETSNKERFSAIYAVAGTRKEPVDSLRAGDFGCVVKLKNGKSNTTLSAIGSGIVQEKIVYPAPKFRCAIKAKVQQDEQKLGDALKKISSQDPTVVVEYSKELRQTILSGNGEQHINIVKTRLVNEYGVQVELFAPKVPYRETITKVATAQYRHKKQSGGAGQFGEVHLLVCPAEGELNTKFKIDGKETILNVKTSEVTDLEWGGKLEFYNCVVGGAIDLGFMPAILKGIKERMVEGPLTGSYARDIRVFVYDGKMHPVDSKEIAFIIAGRNAFKEAFRNAGPKILEPIYNVEVMTPGEYQGAVMSDIQNRRGILGDLGSDKGFSILKARIPLAELYRYSTTLSSLTSGSATFTMEFADYQPVPGDVQTKLLAEYEAQDKEED